ncbi:DoxX family protein [Erythrobacter sp. SCSIO 43205]|uniref:DoxX family protein n=1 Tax=Erythrobacter sp. SCSIO 43205 TaxID=2779361 RepID=UPI001CAA2DF4|nr:DoxX family protein [Erythrobacter sp. SCSIO 43205]UAB78140.1 DoxX family protein [Erythrobacter sp. SCSIO 43205]
MNAITSAYARAVQIISGPIFESIALLGVRVALAGVFWRSYKTKVAEGTWFTPNEFLPFLFQDEYSGLPIPTDIAMPMTIYAEFFLPLLLFAGLFTRFGAAALAGMAIVIQIFIYPTSAHFWGWALGIIAMAFILISRGGGLFALDRLGDRFLGEKAA